MKKLLIIALALMLALSLVACTTEQEPNPNPDNGVIDLNPGTSGNGDDTPLTPGDEQTTEDLSTPNQEAFVECDKTVFIIADVANLRSDTYVSESTWVAYAAKGAEFKCIGYNSSWYKVEYTTEVEGESQTLTCYLHESTAFIKDTTEVALEEPVTLYVIAFALNVRAYYDFEAENVMCTVQQGDELVAVAKGDGWYKTKLANDAQGNEQYGYISANESYVSTTKPEQTTPAEDTTVAEEATTEPAAE